MISDIRSCSPMTFSSRNWLLLVQCFLKITPVVAVKLNYIARFFPFPLSGVLVSLKKWCISIPLSLSVFEELLT